MKHKNDVLLSPSCESLQFHERSKTVQALIRVSSFPFFGRKIILKKYGNVCERSRAGENLPLRLGFSLICSRILPNVRLGFHQAMKARKTCFISFIYIKLLFSD